MMDTDVFAAVVSMGGAFMAFVLLLALADFIRRERLLRRRFQPYDGGCRHRPHTCNICQHRG